MKIATPLLWHGSLEDTKGTAIVVQAAGKGKIEIDAQDDKGRVLGSMFMEVDDTSDDNYFQDVPLSHCMNASFNIDIVQRNIAFDLKEVVDCSDLSGCSDREDITWLVLNSNSHRATVLLATST